MSPDASEMVTIHGDAHVHLHPEFDPERFCAAALARADRLDGPLLLLLAECAGIDAFGALRARAAGSATSGHPVCAVRATAETRSLGLLRRGAAAARVFLVAGRQIVSREGIEVLALGTEPEGPLTRLGDREHPARELVRRILAEGAAAVLPWGVGKWLGSRGREVARLVADPVLRCEPRFLLGDIAARCWPWPQPAAFRAGPRVLAGSDPLPRAGAEDDLARYRFALRARFDSARPAASLLAALDDPRCPVAVEGRRERPWQTLTRQLGYRLRRRGAA